jgi:hypothetical protein
MKIVLVQRSMGRDSAVGIVTSYGLNGPGIEQQLGALLNPGATYVTVCHACR